MFFLAGIVVLSRYKGVRMKDKAGQDGGGYFWVP